jgi:hypothetical protein
MTNAAAAPPTNAAPSEIAALGGADLGLPHLLK